MKLSTERTANMHTHDYNRYRYTVDYIYCLAIAINEIVSHSERVYIVSIAVLLSNSPTQMHM